MVGPRFPNLGSSASAEPSPPSGTAPVPLLPAFLARVCVVVPAFNELRSIEAVVHDIRQQVPGAHVVVVDDGSADGTGAAAKRAGASVVALPVNLGIGAAVQTGYLYARRNGFDVTVQVDGDGQHDPAEIPRLLGPIIAGEADLSLGSRWLGRGDYVAARSRRFGMRVLALLVRWRTGHPFTDTTSGFRAMGPAALELFTRKYPADFPEVESIVMATRSGLRVQEVPVIMTERKHGRSTIAGVRSAYYMARVALALLLGGPGWANPS